MPEVSAGLEPLAPGARILVTGAGSTGRAVVAALASWDVEIRVCDDNADALAALDRISEVLALMPRHSAATMDADFARDVEAAIESHRDQLVAIAEALLVRETLDGNDIDILMKGGTLPPPKAGATPSAPATVEEGPSADPGLNPALKPA